jgi:hypothetical protein
MLLVEEDKIGRGEPIRTYLPTTLRSVRNFNRR